MHAPRLRVAAAEDDVVHRTIITGQGRARQRGLRWNRAKRSRAAGLNDCATCARWRDVIELADADGAKIDRRPFWRRWPKVDGACPDCGRRPSVFVVVVRTRLGWRRVPQQSARS